MADSKRFEELSKKEEILREASRILSVPEKDLVRVIDRFLKEISEMESKK